MTHHLAFAQETSMNLKMAYFIGPTEFVITRPHCIIFCTKHGLKYTKIVIMNIMNDMLLSQFIYYM